MNDQPGPVFSPYEPQTDPARGIAWRVAAALMLLNSLLNVITAVITPQSLTIASLIPATMIDIFLAWNLWRGKSWARQWTIARLVVGLIAWGYLNYQDGGWVSVVATLLIAGPLLLILLGRPRNWRTVVGAALFSLTFLTLLGLTLFGAVKARLNDTSPAPGSQTQEGVETRASNTPSTQSRKMRQAETALDNDDYVTAISLYGEVTRSEPDNAAARYGLCRAYDYSGNPSLAIKSCDKAVDLAPESAEIRAYQAYVLLEMGRYDAALTSAEAALELDDTNSIAYFVRAIVRGNNGDLDAAIQDYDKTIELDPEFAGAYFNRGDAHYGLGDLDAALQDYDKAIELDPQNAGAYNSRGNAHSDLGDLEAALRDYDKAIELAPRDALLYYNRGLARRAQGERAGAIADFQRYLELEPFASDRDEVEGWIIELEQPSDSPWPGSEA